MKPRFQIGGRVITPDGPGEYVETYRSRDEEGGLRWMLVVQLDERIKEPPGGTRRSYTADQLEVERAR